MINRLIYFIGSIFYNHKVWLHYKRLKASESLTLCELRKEQLLKLKVLLIHAYNNSKFYKNLYDNQGFDPKKFDSLDKLKDVPVINKNDLIANNKDIHTYKNNKNLIFSETSGSTGQSLGFYRTKDWDASTRAAMFRGYSWYGVKPWDRNGYFWGYNFSKSLKIRILDALQNRFRIFSYDKENIKKFIKKLKKAKFLEGYSSMIYETAKIINNEGLAEKLNLKLVKGTSEKIFDYYNVESQKAFGKKIVSEYGSAETGVIAFECPYGNMHITMENVIVEVENNEIIVTNLFSHSFPIIRYKLGDYVKMSDIKDCKCGMKHEIIEEVCGRVGGLIKGIKTNYPSLVLYYIFKNISLEHGIQLKYQAIQYEIGVLTLNIENCIDSKTHDLIKNECVKYFHDDIKCIVQDNTPSVRENGKLKDFISYI